MIINTNGVSSGQSLGGYRIGQIVPTFDKELEDDFLWCDGREVHKEEYPELYKQLLPNGVVDYFPLSGSDPSGTYDTYKNSFIRHVNGYLITFYYSTLWYKADNEDTMHSIEWTNINNAGFRFQPISVVWDDINNVFVFLIQRNTASSGDYSYYYTFYTSDLSVEPTQTTNFSKSTPNCMLELKKVGNYWIIKENGSYGYNNGDLFYYTDNLLSGTWQESNTLSTGLSKGGADIAYVEGRYVAGGFLYDGDHVISTEYIAYPAIAYTNIGDDLSSATWQVNYTTHLAQPEFSYGSSQYEGFDHMLYLPNRKLLILLLRGSKNIYYTYNVTQELTPSQKIFYTGNSNIYINEANNGIVIDNVAYVGVAGAVLDVEGFTGDPQFFKTVTCGYESLLTDNMYTLGDGVVQRVIRTLPNLIDTENGIMYKVKAK